MQIFAICRNTDKCIDNVKNLAASARGFTASKLDRKT